jgi:hypothetical protein
MRNYLPMAIALCSSASAACGGGASVPPAPRPKSTEGAVAIDASVVLIEGEEYACPGISSFSINPASVLVGQPAQLGVKTVGPAPSGIEWIADPVSGGTLSSSTSPTPTFLCAHSGEVAVTVGLSLVVPGAGNVCEGAMYTSYSGTIDCE